MEKNYESDYHNRQFREPYRSTVAFGTWLESQGLIDRESRLRILDVGSGAGANIYHLSQRFPAATFVGVDINPALAEQGNAFFRANGAERCRLDVGDVFDLDPAYVSAFDGVISLQTLSWLSDFREPLDAIARLGAPWIAFSSLFYDGPVSCKIDVVQYDEDLAPSWSGFYNVYSLPIVRRHLELSGYPHFAFEPFEIDIDLPKPASRLMSTYTERLASGERLQRSGPLLMPWYFLAARRGQAAAP